MFLLPQKLRGTDGTTQTCHLLPMVAVFLEAKSKTLRADKMMVADPPKGMTGKPFKPPCGAAFRKGVVLNDKEKAKIIRQVRIRELNM